MMLSWVNCWGHSIGHMVVILLPTETYGMLLSRLLSRLVQYNYCEHRIDHTDVMLLTYSRMDYVKWDDMTVL